MRYFEFLAALVLSLSVCPLAAARAPNRPVIKVTADNTVISQSCRVVIPPGTVIKDTDGNGVIQIGAPNIEVEFSEDSVLRGSSADAQFRRVQGVRHSPEWTCGRHHPWCPRERLLVRSLGDKG